jgi:hypothetical protein
VNVREVAPADISNVRQHKMLVGMIRAVKTLLHGLDVVGEHNIDPRLLKRSSD